MRFLVYGAGALGLLLASYLSRSHAVTVVARPRFLDINDVGLRVVGLRSGTFRFHVRSQLEDGRFDAVILSVKSYDIDSSLKELSKHFLYTPLVTVQNGIYAEQAALRVFGPEYVFPASVMMGALVVDSTCIREFLNEGMKIGYLLGSSEGTARILARAFLESGVHIAFSSNIMKDKWYKFMFYCSAASLNSITGAKSMEKTGLLWLTKALLDECVKVGELEDLGFDAKKLAEDVFRFVSSFSPNEWTASVGYDLQHGKSPTEIDYLNGYLIKMAEKHGLDVPFNRTIYSIIKAIESTNYFNGMRSV